MAASSAEAMQAGMPSPSYAAPQTARPGTPRDGRPDPAHPLEVADGVLRQTRRPTAARARRPAAPRARPRRRGPRARAGRAPRRCAAGSPPRGAGRRSSASPARRRPPPAARTQSHFAKEYVDAFTVRPSTGGTRKPDPSVAGMSRARKASVTIAIEAYSIPASSGPAPGATSASSRPVGAAGVASTTASASTISASAGRADHEVPAAVGPRARARARSRRCARREPACVDERAGQPAEPADEPGEDGYVGRGGPAAAAAAASATCPGRAARRPAGRRRARTSRGRDRRRRRRAAARRAGPRTSLPKRCSTSQPTLTSWSSSLGRRQRRLHGGPGQRRRGRARRLASCLVVGRHAHERRRHRAHPAARPQPRRDGRRVHDPVTEPGLAGQLHCLGPPVQHRLGADVDHDPADLGELQLAADLRRGLEHRHLDVGGAASYRGRGRQPGDAAADHDDARASGVRRRWGHRSQVGKDVSDAT